MSDVEADAAGPSSGASNKGGRPADPCLSHFVVKVDHGKNGKDLECKFCHQVFPKCKTKRARAHLAGVSGHGAQACLQVSPAVKAACAATFVADKASGKGNTLVTGQKTLHASLKNANSKLANEAIAAFFFENSIPFNAANSDSYKKMVSALTAQPSSYSGVSAWQIAHPLLDSKYKAVELEVCTTVTCTWHRNRQELFGFDCWCILLDS